MLSWPWTNEERCHATGYIVWQHDSSDVGASYHERSRTSHFLLMRQITTAIASHDLKSSGLSVGIYTGGCIGSLDHTIFSVYILPLNRYIS
jgi:hypothetical protein